MAQELKARTARSIADEEEMLELGADCSIEPTQVYEKPEVDAVLAEKDAEIRRLQRTLWIARAERAKEAYFKWNIFPNFETTDKLFTIDEYDETPGATDGQVLRTCEEWVLIWEAVERKCRAKAEEYK